MFVTNDLDYYRERERTSREHAATASDPAVAAVHGEMARRYAEIVEQAEAGARSLQRLRAPMPRA